MNAIIGDAFELLPKDQRDFLAATRIPLRKQTLNWEYGDNESNEAWIFADFQERNVVAACCLGGFGSMGSPWGLVFFLKSSFGMDRDWYRSLGELLSDGWTDNAA